MFRSISKYFYFSFLPFGLASIFIAGLFATGHISLWYLLITFVLWVLISGLGVALGYHRIFSHNTLPNVATWKECVMMFFGTLSGQGSALTWAAIHKGYHHPFSDTPRDFHSPIVKMDGTPGTFMHAFVGWTLAITEDTNNLVVARGGKRVRSPHAMWFHKHQFKILYGVPFALFVLFGWEVAAAQILATGIGLFQDNFINYAGHKKLWRGYRSFDTKDQSYNHRLLSWFTWGQALHNNHHQWPNALWFDLDCVGSFDPCRLFQPFLYTEILYNDLLNEYKGRTWTLP